MDFEKYSERSRGFLQSAQGLALRRGHQRLAPEHLLKVLIDDKEGLASNLIQAAGGDAQKALGAVEAALDRLPRVEGSGAGQIYLSPELARVFEQAEKLPRRPAIPVTVERLLMALAMDGQSPAGKALVDAGATPQALNRAVEAMRKGARPIAPMPKQGTTR